MLITAFCHQGALVVLQRILLMIKIYILFMDFWEYFCPTWSEGVKGSPHVFPCLSQSALHQFLPALWSWRLWMSHPIQRKQTLSLCQKKHLCWSTFIREKTQRRHLGATHHEKAGFIRDRGTVPFIHSGKRCSGVYRRRANRNTQTHTSVHSFWNSAAANRIKIEPSAQISTGGFHGNCPPFLLKGRASH